MRVGSRAGWAVGVSLAVHALVVAVATHLTRAAETPRALKSPALDTRVAFGAEPVPEPSPPTQLVPPPEPEPPTPIEPPTPAQSPDPPVMPHPPVAAGGPSSVAAPQKIPVPSALSEVMLARVRRFAGTPPPIVDPAVRPAAARPVHGALAAGQRVVYLLDTSGSMGEWGKFAAARDVLAATAACQPAGVDVKVVVYSGTAEVATPAALAARTPLGRGDHLAGLRLALAQEPDFVVWFTDAADLPAASVRAQLRRVARPVTLVVARVGPNGVAAPAELR